MMNKRVRFLTVLIVLISVLGGCSAKNQTEEGALPAASAPIKEDTSVSEGVSEEQNNEQADDIAESSGIPGSRPFLIKDMDPVEVEEVVPCVEEYVIEPDLSNVTNLYQFYLEDEMTKKLSQNGFVVAGDAGREFFEIYEINRYDMKPNFVTVDSMMHTYHLYFSYLLKNIERNYLSDSIEQLSRRMLEQSISQYDRLKGSEWENAAARNVAFFTVGAKLLDGSIDVKEYAADTVAYELNCIEQAAGISESEITGDFEDYSQYIPRGYYEGDEKLEKYFKAMMWYGRIHFAQKDEDMDRSALLITKAFYDDPESYKIWESVYAVTSFFAGASDDMGVCEYAAVVSDVYGSDFSLEDLIANKDGFTEFHNRTASLTPPRINSIPIEIGEDNVIPGFRFMGQRFTIDASIMQKLIYSNVKENSEGLYRMLPDVLDVPAALGSDAALTILEENGAAEYKGYSENMNKLRESFSKENSALWSASLYANWLNTLRPLLTVKGEGYPVFMQSEEWSKKDIECFAGSFTELKHDTILYSKQVIAEMGGGYEEEPDYRGYVEPEPLVYARFAHLAELTAQGLKSYDMLNSADEENLSRLAQMAKQLLTISNKELKDEVLTDEEYDFIESYGGNIEHFWYEAVKEETDGDAVSSQEIPAAVVVDIATDPNGSVLEAATGDPSVIYVVVEVDGVIKIARGSVYSFYQFIQPLEDRLTDSKWLQMMGIQADEDGYFSYDNRIEKPDWTDSYRYQYEWE